MNDVLKTPLTFPKKRVLMALLVLVYITAGLILTFQFKYKALTDLSTRNYYEEYSKQFRPLNIAKDTLSWPIWLGKHTNKTYLHIGEPSRDISSEYPTITLDEGEFVYYQDYSDISYPTEYPCVNDADGAIFVLTSQKYGYRMDPDPEIIKTAQTKILKEYVNIYHVDYYGRDKYYNIFKCDYFKAFPKDSTQSYKTSIQLGRFGGPYDIQSFKNLIAFLRATEFIDPIQQCGFNCKMVSQKLETKEDKNQITIQETTIMEVYNDTPPFGTSNWTPAVEYILDKNTGVVSEKRFQN